MNKKGFTLIEMIAVVIILGIVLLIAVPAVTSYIRGSDDSVYVNSMASYLQQAKLLYSEKQIGPYIGKNEIMVLPIRNITLEKSNIEESPYGKIVFTQSYVVIERTENAVRYYVSVLDKAGRGFVDKREDELNNKIINKSLRSMDLQVLNASYTCVSQTVNGTTKILPRLETDSVFVFRGNNYRPVEYRIYPEENYNCETVLATIIYEKV